MTIASHFSVNPNPSHSRNKLIFGAKKLQLESRKYARILVILDSDSSESVPAESMKAVELKGRVDEQGNLSLDEPISGTLYGAVRVIVLFSEDQEEPEIDPDDTPLEEVKASLKRALQEAKNGDRIPLSQLWEGIDAD
jgi:hypothetical protein